MHDHTRSRLHPKGDQAHSIAQWSELTGRRVLSKRTQFFCSIASTGALPDSELRMKCKTPPAGLAGGRLGLDRRVVGSVAARRVSRDVK
jgi:hypothetical protein